MVIKVLCSPSVTRGVLGEGGGRDWSWQGAEGMERVGEVGK